MTKDFQLNSDRLVWLLNRFELKASVFQVGHLPNPASFSAKDGLSYIHILRGGKLLLENAGQPSQLLDEPSIFLYMNPTSNQLKPQDENVDIICASFDFATNLRNPLVQALPEMILVKQKNTPSLLSSLDLLFNEAKENHCGRQAILDRQIEIIIIQLLRNLMDKNLLKIGLLAGLADTRLARAINAIHEKPERSWSLEELATTAGMSRAQFATRFRETVGITPGNYITEWRIGIAQSLLNRGKPIQLIADTVGYSNASALSRAFSAQTGLSPSEWRKQNQSK